MIKAKGFIILIILASCLPVDSSRASPDDNQVVTATAADCSLITDGWKRLDCYDQKQAKPKTPEQEAFIASLKDSPWSERYFASRDTPFSITPYKPNYILPVTYNRTPNTEPFENVQRPGSSLQKYELKYQISVEAPIWNSILDSKYDMYFAYTQTSFWQLYNSDASSPFRETSYEPELGIKFNTSYEFSGLHTRQIRFGVVHQSNGKSELLSRSWNRIFAIFIMDVDDLAMVFRPWVRVKEDDPGDDNPDIDDYLGNFEWNGTYKYKNQTFSLMLRNTLDSHHHGAMQLHWSYPLSKRIKLVTQYFNGYGESLIDYDHKSQRLGIGILLTDWL